MYVGTGTVTEERNVRAELQKKREELYTLDYASLQVGPFAVIVAKEATHAKYRLKEDAHRD